MTSRYRLAAFTVLTGSLAVAWVGTANAQVAPVAPIPAPADYTGGAPDLEFVTPDLTSAEAVLPRDYDRGENVSVLQAPRPGYDAVGIRDGSITFFPKVIASFTFDDNVLAIPSGPSDEIFTVSPQVSFTANWGRSGVSGYARFSTDQDVHVSDNDDIQYDAGLSGQYEAGQTSFVGGISGGQYVEPRTTVNDAINAVNQVGYQFADVNGQVVQEFNRLRLSVRADYDYFNYQNGVTSTGATLFEDLRDRGVTTIAGKAEYAISPNIAVVAAGSYNYRDYFVQPPQAPTDNSSSGYEFDLGANFDITHFIRGELEVGYLRQHYVSPVFNDIVGPAARGQLEWFPRQMDTVTLTVSRSIGDSGLPGTPGFLETTATAELDHELLRNVILTGNFSYALQQYNGIDRTDQQWGPTLAAKWLLNRRFGLNFSYEFLRQQSAGASAGLSYNDNRLFVSTIVQW
ncbi:MAG TPA: outer membrane beta-barrel protein [Caulobacteraceae bacterium]